MNIQKQRVKTESDLKTREKVNEYRVRATIMWCGVAFLILLGIATLVILASYAWHHQEVQKKILDTFLDNVDSLVIGLAVFLGIKSRE